MNTKINEDYCDFETAKLLKEKGFDCSCEHQYINCSSRHPFLTDIRDDAGCYYKNSEIGQDEYSTPTLQMAMKWLREVHNLYIWIGHAAGKGLSWYYEIHGISDGKVKHIGGIQCGSYEVACEAAIKYCLTNLI